MAHFSCTMVSYVLKRAVDLTVVIPSLTYPEISEAEAGKTPPSHRPPHKFPVLYLLHGYSGNHSSWPAYTRAEMYAEERKIAIVTLSAENKGYVDAGEQDRYFAFVSQELPEFIEGMFPVSQRPEDRYIAGLSMGGYGAMVHALNHPQFYRAAGSFSGAVLLTRTWQEKEDSRYDPLALAQNLVREKRKFPALYLACGEKDFLYQANVEFESYLKENGVPHSWVTHPDYSHEWRFWDWQLEAFLDWLPRSDPYRLTRTFV